MTLDDLREYEAAKYDIQWQEPWYREKCHSLTLWNEHRDLFPRDVDTAIDYGSGTGRLVKHWRTIGIEAKGVDISTKAADPDSFPLDRALELLAVQRAKGKGKPRRATRKAAAAPATTAATGARGRSSRADSPPSA